MTTSLIGAGQAYTTLQTWFDAAPANLVTSAVIWQGKINAATDSFASTVGVTPLNMSGHTVDATHYFELTTNAGASFIDDAAIQTHALRYGANAGCTISTSISSAIGITVNQDYTRLSNLQISALGSAITLGSVGALNCDINRCIIEGTSTTAGALFMYGAGNKVRNSLIVQRADSAAMIAEIRNGAAAYNCTFVVPNDIAAAAVGIAGSYTTCVLENCGVFHATAFSSGTAPTLTTCASDVAAATGHIQVAYSAATFVNITDATRDFRLLSGSGLINVGTTDAANAAVDIAGTARPSGSAYDIGAWELASSAATAVTMTGPSAGTVSVTSSNFTVGANGTITGTVIVTPSDSAGGGTFTPTTVSISSGTPTGTFTYTPASVGAKTISVTNNGSLTNPANIIYTASAAGSRIFLPNWDMSGISGAGPFFGNRLQ